jgi:hypothetical protein
VDRIALGDEHEACLKQRIGRGIDVPDQLDVLIPVRGVAALVSVASEMASSALRSADRNWRTLVTAGAPIIVGRGRPNWQGTLS